MSSINSNSDNNTESELTLDTNLTLDNNPTLDTNITLDTNLTLDSPLKDFSNISGWVDMNKINKVCNMVDFGGLSEKECNWYIDRLKDRLEYIKRVEIHTAYRAEKLLGVNVFNDVVYFLKGDEYVKGEEIVLNALINKSCKKGKFNFSITEVRMSMMEIEGKIQERKWKHGF